MSRASDDLGMIIYRLNQAAQLPPKDMRRVLAEEVENLRGLKRNLRWFDDALSYFASGGSTP